MNLKTPKLSTNFWIIMGTVIFMVLIYFFYLNFYVASKEKRIVSTRFRVLHQIGMNINSKLNSYEGNALNLKKMITEQIDRGFTYRGITQQNLEGYIDSWLIPFIEEKGHINKDLKLEKIDILYSSSPSYPSNKDKYYFKNLNIKISDTTYIRPTVTTTYDKLVSGMDRHDVFDGMFLMRDSDVIYNSLGQDLLLNLTSIDIDPFLGKVIKKIEEDKNGNFDHSILLIPKKEELKAATLYSGELADVNISNHDYKLFLVPVIVDGETWFLGGLMHTENFNSARRSIASWIIILLSLVLILIIFSLPMIKLQVLSKIEKLDTSTVISSAISLLVGGSVAILFLFFITQSISRQLEIDRNLKDLSDSLSSSFTAEIEDAYYQLAGYDAYWDELSKEKSSNPNNDKIWTDILNTDHGLHYLNPNCYKYFDYIFWLDKNGQQTREITPYRVATQLINVKSRDYFKHKDEWFMPDGSNNRFRIQSIVSLTSGNHKLALSTVSKSRENEAIAMSSRFTSIIDPIIPMDYSFAIIDKTGKVWFHSNKNKNMMENFIAETNNDDGIRAALYTSNDAVLTINYYNREHRAYIRPIKNLPLYMVTLTNRDAEKSFHAQVFTMTMLLLGTFFALIFIQVFVLLWIERIWQWRLNKNLIMSITRPMSHLNKRYRYLFWLNVLLIIVTTPFILRMSDQEAIASAFILQVILFGYGHWMINTSPHKKIQKYLFAVFNFMLFVTINVVFIYLGDIQLFSNFDYFEGYQWILIYQAAILVSIAIMHILWVKGIKLKTTSSYINNYARFLLTVVIIFGIIPALKFYESGYNTEKWLRVKHAQLDLMLKYEARNEKIRDYYKGIAKTPEKDNSAYISTGIDSAQISRRNSGIYSEFFSKTRILPYYHKPDSGFKELIIKDNNWNDLIHFFRPYYDDYITENKFITYNHLADGSHNWYLEDEDEGLQIFFEYPSLTSDLTRKESIERYIKSEVELLKFFTPFRTEAFDKELDWVLQFIYNLIFWSAAITLLFILFKLIQFGNRRIFCLTIVDNYSHQPFSSVINTQMLANKDILITRLSNDDRTDKLKEDLMSRDNIINIDWSIQEEIEDTEGKINGLLNMLKMNKEENPGADSNLTVYIEHFDWSFNDAEVLLNKIRIINNFTDREDIRLIILSNFRLEFMIDYYEKQAASEESDKADKSIKLAQKLRQLTEQMIIDALPVNYHYDHIKEQEFCNQKTDVRTVEHLIQSETNASDYLKQYESAVMDYYLKNCQNQAQANAEERVIAKINSLAGKYYSDLLTNCSYEERYVLHDFADDLIVNPKNEGAIYSLLNKGLLVKRCDKLDFMNISFRRHVLTALTKEEAREIEAKMGKGSGTWQGYRTTLIIIILALFVFIAVANQDFLDNLNQLFVALGGGVAVITGVLGLVSKKSRSGPS